MMEVFESSTNKPNSTGITRISGRPVTSTANYCLRLYVCTNVCTKGVAMPRKRSSGEGGLYFIPSRKLWRGVVDLGFSPDGRRVQKYVHARTQTDARKKLNALKAEIEKHGAPLDKQTTVEDWAEHWLTTVCRPTYKPRALGSAESVVRTWVVPHIGRKRVAQLQPSDVRAVLQQVRNKGRSTASARKVYDIMSRMLESARLDGVAPRNVAADVVAPKVKSQERGALSTEQGFAILGAAAGTLDGTKWWVSLLSGLRQGERLGATIDSLDLDAGILTVQWELAEITSEHGCGERVNGVWPCGKKQGAACPESRHKLPDGMAHRHLYGRLFLVPPKSGRSREVPLVPQVVEALRRYLKATEDVPNPHGLIWRHDDGTPFLPNEDQQAWRVVLFQAGIITEEQTLPPRDRPKGTPDVPTTHWARHTTATILMELEVDAKIIGEIVGHVDVKTTQRYQHVSSAAARDAANRLGAHFAKALGA